MQSEHFSEFWLSGFAGYFRYSPDIFLCIKKFLEKIVDNCLVYHIDRIKTIKKGEHKMKKRMKHIVCALCVILLLVALAGCKSKGTDITSNWKLVEYTVKGKTTVIDDQAVLVKAVTASDNPKFSCKDGKNCVFESGGKAHQGTVTLEGDTYVINYNDTSKKMFGRIENDKLTLTNESKSLEFIFTAK